jgi:hypothetical protein
MRLDDYLARDDASVTELAQKVRRHLPRGSRTTPSTLSRLKRTPGQKELRTASPLLALAIEKATDGLVKAEQVPLSRESRRVLRQLRSASPLAPTEPTPAGDAAA